MESIKTAKDQGVKERGLTVILVILACLFNLAAYQVEFTVDAPDLNDHVYHYGMMMRMNEAWEAGDNPLDPWISNWGQGFPVLRYYQHLSHLVVVTAYRALGGSVSLYQVFKFANLLLLVLLPLSFYWGARLLGFGRRSAGFTALCTPLLQAASERYFLGIQPTTFTWMGGGLFPQLLGIALFAPALGLINRAVLTGRRFGPALLFLSATWLAHLLLGYMACLFGLLVLLRPEARGQRGKGLIRLGMLYGLCLAAISYLILPNLLESDFINRSIWEGSEYWDSFGIGKVMASLLSGGLLDGAHFPVLTLLAGLGIISGALALRGRANRSGPAIFTIAFLSFALLLFFGRPTWGALLHLLPMSDNLPFHRFICAVQYAGLLLAGYGLANLWNFVADSRSMLRVIAALVLTAILLSTAVQSTLSSASQLKEMKTASAANFDKNGRGLDEQLRSFAKLNRTNPGRGYSGTSWDWGKQYLMSDAPVYSYWSRYGLPAVSYMYHTMGLNSDLEPAFDPKRRDHYELFNVRYLMTYDQSLLPSFVELIAVKPGIFAATVETSGYFDVVRVSGSVARKDFPSRAFYDFNRKFIEGHWHSDRRFIRVRWREGDRIRVGEKELKSAEDLLAFDSLRTLPAGAVLSSWGEGNRYGAEVDIKQASQVLFRMTYHPGWQATVDGKIVGTEMLSPSLIGIPVKSGRHKIVMHYSSGLYTGYLFWLWPVLIILALIGDRLKIWPSAFSKSKPDPYARSRDAGEYSLRNSFRSLIDTLRDIPKLRWWLLLFAIFLATRIWLLFFFSDAAWSDIRAYFLHYGRFTELNLRGEDFFADLSFQYPPLLLPFILFPGWLAGLFGKIEFASYAQAFRSLMFLFDAGLFLCLPFIIRAAKPDLSSRQLIFRTALYIPILLLMPDLAYDRLDIAITFTVALSLLWLALGRAQGGLFLLGLAASMKLAPLLLAFPILIWSMLRQKEAGLWPTLRTPLPWLAGIAAGFLPFALVSGAAAFNFLEYQGARGLQIESIPASMGMVLHFFGLTANSYNEAMATSLNFPGSAVLKQLWTVLGILALAGLATFSWLRRDQLLGSEGFGRALHLALLMLASALVFSSVFSPQFLIWLLPLMVALPVGGRNFIALIALSFFLLLFTSLVFPHFYLELVDLKPLAMVFLILRNLLMVLLAILLFKDAIRRKPAAP